MRRLLESVTTIDQIVGGARFLGMHVEETPVESDRVLGGDRIGNKILADVIDGDIVFVWVQEGLTDLFGTFTTLKKDEIKANVTAILQKVNKNRISDLADSVKVEILRGPPIPEDKVEM